MSCLVPRDSSQNSSPTPERLPPAEATDRFNLKRRSAAELWPTRPPCRHTGLIIWILGRAVSAWVLRIPPGDLNRIAVARATGITLHALEDQIALMRASNLDYRVVRSTLAARP